MPFVGVKRFLQTINVCALMVPMSRRISVMTQVFISKRRKGRENDGVGRCELERRDSSGIC